MGARMGFDLRTKSGWGNLLYTYRHKAYKRDWRIILTDTFMPLVCYVLGHAPYNSSPGGTEEWACKRCYHFIKDPS